MQTLSKMPNKYVEGVYPVFLEQGNGCYVSDGEGNQFIDYPLGLGTVLLGHNNNEVTTAVIERIIRGIIFTLSSRLETELAKKLCEIIPCAEQVRFLKTGSEATSAAVKIARAYTGRNKIAYCGYHGWHDWFTVATPKNAGIPREYKQFIAGFKFNNIDSLEKILTDQHAAVILEPCIFDEPKDNFLKKVIKLAHKFGAVVIFDEVVTGFRFPGYSAQKYFEVEPDLSTFGKAMGNGFPISLVCGKKKIMQVLEGDCFVSSTFGGDLTGITAALAVIKILENTRTLENIWFLGEYLRDGYNEIARELNIETSAKGYPNRTMHIFPTAEHKSLFWQECIQRGVFFGYAQFICGAHTQNEIDYTLEVIKDALKVCKENWKKPEKALKGKTAKEVFRLIVEKNNQ